MPCSSLAKSPTHCSTVVVHQKAEALFFLLMHSETKEFFAGSSTTTQSTLQLSYGSLTPDPADARRQFLTCASAAARTHGTRPQAHSGTALDRSPHRRASRPARPQGIRGAAKPRCPRRHLRVGTSGTQPIRAARTLPASRTNTSRLEIPAKATSLPRLLLALRRGFRGRPAWPRTKVGRAPSPIHNSHAAHHVTRRRPRRAASRPAPPLY
jgi:hypothetical protein